MSDDKIQACIDNISDFYFGDNEECGESLFKKFAETHKDKFSSGLDEAMEGEQKLEYTEAYKEFQKLFEEKIEEIILKTGVSQEEFVFAIKERSKTDPEIKMFLDILVSVSDYVTFAEMMADYVSQNFD